MRPSAADTRTRELTTRDLVTTGVLTALYAVFMMAEDMSLAPNPVLTFWVPAAVALLARPVYLLLITKISKHGPLIVLGVVEEVLLFVIGMYWIWAVACVVLGVVADLFTSAGGFTNRVLNFAVLVLYSLSPMGFYLMLWIDPGGYTSYPAGNGTERAYMDTTMSTATGWVLPAMILATVAYAIVGGLVGMRLLRRQLEGAGTTA